MINRHLRFRIYCPAPRGYGLSPVTSRGRVAFRRHELAAWLRTEQAAGREPGTLFAALTDGSPADPAALAWLTAGLPEGSWRLLPYDGDLEALIDADEVRIREWAWALREGARGSHLPSPEKADVTLRFMTHRIKALPREDTP